MSAAVAEEEVPQGVFSHSLDRGGGGGGNGSQYL